MPRPGPRGLGAKQLSFLPKKEIWLLQTISEQDRHPFDMTKT
jgi:hypothetical protein